MKNIMQGDQYNIPVRVLSGGAPLTPDTAEKLELVIGGITKSYPGEITYSDCWQFPLTQQESINLAPGVQPVQIRVRFRDGSVVGRKCGCVSINSSDSHEIL